MAKAANDVYNAAVEYGDQRIGVDRLKDEQKSALVEFLRIKDVSVSLPTGIRSCTICLDTIWTLCVVVCNQKKAT